MAGVGPAGSFWPAVALFAVATAATGRNAGASRPCFQAVVLDVIALTRLNSDRPVARHGAPAA